ncbi:MAG: hypothetical protein JSU73_12000 [candidate division WOR-3 bacterium]|nr:MAG: hypothetical protein JSU73_12000 [candidate division WOR-3 bacterium]
MRAKLVFAVGLVLTLAVAAAAGASSDLAAPAVNPEAVDAATSTVNVTSYGGFDFDYTVEWAWKVSHSAVVGLTPVQDTLLWVSSGGRTGSPDPNYMLIYDIRDGTLLDSFPQQTTTLWGYRDMCYLPDSDYVYAGTDGSRLDVINATSHQLAGTYTVTGSNVPSTIRALATDGDSLYSANFTSSPIVKFSRTGQNCHMVGGIPSRAIYGIALDMTHNKAYASTGDNSYMLHQYDPTTWQLQDSARIIESRTHGGVEMWGDDIFLLLLDQTGDSVFCLRLGEPLTHDCGVTQIIDPDSMIQPGSIAPKTEIKNFGTQAQSDIPCYFVIDSSGSNVYSEMETYAGPLAPGATAEVTFTNWTAVGGTYDLTAFTNLAGDDNPSNDTMTGTVQVVALAWETISSPTTAQDKIVHVTVWDPGTDMVYQVGGNPAGATGTYDGICRAYDPEGDSWVTKATMPTPLGWMGYGLVGGKIYALGGHDNFNQMIGTSQEYDIASNTWTAKAARPVGLGAPLSATWRDTLIYIMGGTNGSTGSNRVDVYDPASNSWLTGTNLPEIADMGSAVIIGDTIYIAQALNRGTSRCWTNLYKGAIDPGNPTSINWIQGPVLAEPVFNGATVAVAGEVYWMGGFINATTVTSKIWKYSPTTGMVTTFAPSYPITVARSTFAAARDASWGWEIYGMAGDMNGNWSPPNQTYTKLALPITGVGEGTPPRPLSAGIVSVRPSIGRGFASISYSVANVGLVNLGVYDASGSLVRTLVEGVVEPGTQTAVWNRTDDAGHRVSNGTYFYRLTVDGQTLSSKSVVLD